MLMRYLETIRRGPLLTWMRAGVASALARAPAHPFQTWSLLMLGVIL